MECLIYGAFRLGSGGGAGLCPYHPVVADIINAYEKDAPKVDFEEKSEETNKLEEETASGLTEYPVIGAEDVKK